MIVKNQKSDIIQCMTELSSTRGGPTTVRLELIFAESAFNKTCLYRRVRAPITKTRPNSTKQRSKSKNSATSTSTSKFYENADVANINARRTVVGPPLV